MELHIGSDHAGFEMKGYLIDKLKESGFSVIDHGTWNKDSTDYPDYAHATALAVESGGGMGILLCGSANGVCMTANKHQGIRAALCWNSEIAVLARQHNNANIICLPARYLQPEEALVMVKAFLETAFEGGRHQKRVEKIACK